MGGTEYVYCMCWHLYLPRRTALLRIPCMQECVYQLCYVSPTHFHSVYRESDKTNNCRLISVCLNDDVSNMCQGDLQGMYI